MRFCKYCGNQISEDINICTFCGKRLDLSQKEKDLTAHRQKSNNKKILILILVIAVLVIGIIGIIVISRFGRCKYSGCNNKTVDGSDYCYNHKCSVSDCNNSQTYNSNFCYSHHLLYDDTDDSYASPTKSVKKVYEWQLNISVDDVYTKYGRTYAEGRLMNNGDSTVKFVTLKGAFQTYSGSTIDTATTYAVGSEGLAPGEITKWKMSVSGDSNITQCKVTITDYDD